MHSSNAHPVIVAHQNFGPSFSPSFSDNYETHHRSVANREARTFHKDTFEAILKTVPRVRVMTPPKLTSGPPLVTPNKNPTLDRNDTLENVTIFGSMPFANVDESLPVSSNNAVVSLETSLNEIEAVSASEVSKSDSKTVTIPVESNSSGTGPLVATSSSSPVNIYIERQESVYSMLESPALLKDVILFMTAQITRILSNRYLA